MEQLSVWVVTMGSTGFNRWAEKAKDRYGPREPYSQGRITGIYTTEVEAYASLPRPETVRYCGEFDGGDIYEYEDGLTWVLICERSVRGESADADATQEPEDLGEEVAPVSRREFEELQRQLADLERRTLKMPDGTPPPVINPFPYGPWGPPSAPPITLPPYIPPYPHTIPYYVGDPPYQHPGYYVGDPIPPYRNTIATGHTHE